ncbi:MAG TPA: lipopolysaccharide assembly protein LapA domain-containing protein [Acidimicrobiia bacterium]
MVSKRAEPIESVDDHTRSDATETPGRTRLSSTWTFAALGAAVLILLLVFVVQNSQEAALEFLWFDFELPMGAALLLAGAIGGLLVVLIGASRLLQLRLAARRRRSHGRSGRTTP